MICLKLILDLCGILLKFNLNLFSLALHLGSLHIVGLIFFKPFVALGTFCRVSNLGRFKILSITELRLHVLEKCIVDDLNVLNLDRLNVNSPANQRLLSTFHNTLLDLVTILQEFTNAHVGDAVADDGRRHARDLGGNLVRLGDLDLSPEALVQLERAAGRIVRSPDQRDFDIHCLHFAGDLFGVEFLIAQRGGEPDRLLPRPENCIDADSFLHCLTVLQNNQPLVRFRFHPVFRYKVKGLFRTEVSNVS